eukprot:XP_016657766.1 PREDICTED: uncharacterized protein LOC107882993 [Acyrthosiphon pisum]
MKPDVKHKSAKYFRFVRNRKCNNQKSNNYQNLKKPPNKPEYSSAPEFSDSSDGVFDDSDEDECSNLSRSYKNIDNVGKNKEFSSNKASIIEDDIYIINSPN